MTSPNFVGVFVRRHGVVRFIEFVELYPKYAAGSITMKQMLASLNEGVYWHRVEMSELKSLVSDVETQALYDTKHGSWVDVRTDNPALKRLLNRSVKVG